MPASKMAKRSKRQQETPKYPPIPPGYPEDTAGIAWLPPSIPWYHLVSPVGSHCRGSAVVPNCGGSNYSEIMPAGFPGRVHGPIDPEKQQFNKRNSHFLSSGRVLRKFQSPGNSPQTQTMAVPHLEPLFLSIDLARDPPQVARTQDSRLVKPLYMPFRRPQHMPPTQRIRQK